MLITDRSMNQAGSVPSGTKSRKRLQYLTLFALTFICFTFSQAAFSQQEFARTAFTECPAKAFLTQGKQPSTYAVNLVTGDYNVVALSHGTLSPLNALGFNTHDN